MKDTERLEKMIGALRKLHSEEPPGTLIDDIIRPDRELRSAFADMLRERGERHER